MSSAAQRVAARCASAITSAEVTDHNIPRLERIVHSLESEAKQMVSALEKYKSDPGKNKPQLDNVAHGAAIMASSIRVLLRTLGKDE